MYSIRSLGAHARTSWHTRIPIYVRCDRRSNCAESLVLVPYFITHTHFTIHYRVHSLRRCCPGYARQLQHAGVCWCELPEVRRDSLTEQQRQQQRQRQQRPSSSKVSTIAGVRGRERRLFHSTKRARRRLRGSREPRNGRDKPRRFQKTPSLAHLSPLAVRRRGRR